MKKILLISMILASGCIAPKTPDPTPIPSKEPTIAPTSTPIPTPTPTAEAKKEFIFGETPAIFSNNFWPYLQEQTWEVGLPYPTSTDVFFLGKIMIILGLHSNMENTLLRMILILRL